ncbi:MAG: potassium transporter KtrB, partial [Clostridia bacterium]|nr:potassium transporter KtrB [Clostridia bacterium]
ELSLFRRRISKQAVSKAVAVITVSFMIMFISTLLLSAVTDADLIDIAYETVSASATVGLTRDLTPKLNIWGKIIIIITMYLGRVGPISLLIAFNIKKQRNNIIKDPVETISIG